MILAYIICVYMYYVCTLKAPPGDTGAQQGKIQSHGNQENKHF
jgi:hypothetical protein